jgi:NAD(P)-dependent dehydrogenase (short-subunit alcohol dehydrogenase family)
MEKKNLIIIGGFGRIGRAFINDSKNKNYNLIIIDKKNYKAKNKFDFYKSDIEQKKTLFNTFKKIFINYKKIHAVVNLSYPINKHWGKKFETLDEKDLKNNLFLQLGTSILVAQTAIKFFLKQKFGNLILTSSILGVMPPKFEHYKNTNMFCPIEYSASKSGIISITKYLAKLYGKNKIRVNCVSPGGIKENQSKFFLKRYKNSCLSKGMLDPKDINGAINFLLSENSNFVNGQNIIIDDGWSL